MAITQPNRLREQARNAGLSVLELVKATVVSEGSKLGAARKLNVAPGTIDYHLKKAGITLVQQQTIVFVEAQS